MKVLKNVKLVAVLAFVLGVLLVLVIRFATYQVPKKVHYHANFAVYINGQREEFKDAFYYEETGAACASANSTNPHDRAHMHDDVNDVVHVHDAAVTWNNFFNNIGWNINPRFVNTPTQLLAADDTNKVTFILNDKVTDNIANRVIGDRDRLLVNYGDQSSSQLGSEFKSIAKSANYYDTHKDPASCAGQLPTTFHDRITHLF